MQQGGTAHPAEVAGLRPAQYLPQQPDETALRPRGLSAPISRYERFRVSGRFGDMWAPQLDAILWKLDRGYLDDWADLCEFALASDTTLASLYVTRISRVSQAEFVMKPSSRGDQTLAKLAAEFCDEQLARIGDWEKSQRHLLHAIFVGASFAEMEWARDGASKTNYIRRIHGLHTHRFRYDEKWIPRLYDQGQRTKTNIYGEVLDPRRYIVHEHQEIAGYPNVGGVFRPAAMMWMFSRWAMKWFIQGTEKFGAPFVVGTVVPNANAEVRQDALTQLENLVADHVALKEAGGDIEFKSTPLGTSSSSMYEQFLNRADAQLAKCILGSSDFTDPGQSGSQAAVAVRGGITVDPRMVIDSLGYSETIEKSVLTWLLALNVHKFGGIMPPVPEYLGKTASDEVKVDVQGMQAQEEAGGVSPNANVDSGGAPAAKKPATDAPGATPKPLTASVGADSPKALSRSSSGRQTAERMTRTSSQQLTISQIGLPSATKLAEALRGASVDPARS